MDQIGPIREGAHERNREPVTRRLAQPNLILHIVRQMGKRVTLCHAALVGNLLIASGKRNRLEAEEADGFGIVERELNDTANLLVVDAVDDRRNWNDLHAGVMQVVNGLELYVEQIADFAVRIRGVSDAIELEINITQASFCGLAANLFTLCELNAITGGLHRVVANLARIGDRVEEVRRKRGLATRELHGHLTTRLDRDRVVEHGLDLVPGKFVDESNLVGV